MLPWRDNKDWFFSRYLILVSNLRSKDTLLLLEAMNICGVFTSTSGVCTTTLYDIAPVIIVAARIMFPIGDKDIAFLAEGLVFLVPPGLLEGLLAFLISLALAAKTLRECLYGQSRSLQLLPSLQSLTWKKSHLSPCWHLPLK